MAEKSKVLIIGATGYIGKHIAKASVKAGHPTFMLTRESTSTNPDKSAILEELKHLGVEVEIVRIITMLQSFITLDLCIYMNCVGRS